MMRVFVCGMVIILLNACDQEQDNTHPTPPASVSTPAPVSPASTTTLEIAADGSAGTAIGAENNGVTQTDPASGIREVEIAAGAKLANERCQTCHGESGDKAKAATPFLAGQHAPYLLSAMQSYAGDSRRQEDMKLALQSLTGADLVNIAAFYASQSAPWKSQIAVDHPDSGISPIDIEAGEKKSASCIGCHGPDGNSQLPGVPSLAGMQPGYFEPSLNSYFNGSRSEMKVIMRYFRNSLNKKDIRQLAAYYSSQKPLKSHLPVNGNSKAGEKLASRKCAGCHGLDGNSGNPKIPSLTAQNADYLTQAIKNYKTGQRKEDLMKEAVAALSVKQIADIAAYFATRNPKKIGLTNTRDDKTFNPLGQGESIAATCVGCHGAQGDSTTPNTPNLAGLHPTYLGAAIRAYKVGTRKHEMMQGFVATLADPDIEKVSLYFASLEPAALTATPNTAADAGEKIAQACTACHGERGNSTQAGTPAIAGQDANYLVTAIHQYKSALRRNQAMQDAVAALEEDDIKSLAAYFATQSRVKPEIDVPEAPEILAQKCNRCHGENGHSTNPAVPRIAAQNVDYIINALKAYKNQARINTTMYAMAEVLSDLEITAIANYYASQE